MGLFPLSTSLREGGEEGASGASKPPSQGVPFAAYAPFVPRHLFQSRKKRGGGEGGREKRKKEGGGGGQIISIG